MVRTRDDVEMDVPGTLGFGEQCDPGLAAMDDLAERRGDSGHHRAGLRLPGQRQLPRSYGQPHRPAVRISFASRAMVQIPSAPQAQFSQFRVLSGFRIGRHSRRTPGSAMKPGFHPVRGMG
jgi:hypothetical protein